MAFWLFLTFINWLQSSCFSSCLQQWLHRLTLKEDWPQNTEINLFFLTLMTYFPDANYMGQYSIIGCYFCCSKHTKSTGNAISLIFIDTSTMKLPWENIPTEKMNTFNHLLFSLNWWVDNNLTLQVQHLLCSFEK